MSDWMLSALAPLGFWRLMRPERGAVTAQQAFALAIAGRIQELSLAETPLKRALDPWTEAEVPDETEGEWKFVYVTAMIAMADEYDASYIDWLRQFLSDGRQDADARVVSGLLSAVLHSFRNDYHAASSVVSEALDNLRTEPGVSELSILAMQCQLARRLLESSTPEAALAATSSVIWPAELGSTGTHDEGDDVRARAELLNDIVDSLRSAQENIVDHATDLQEIKLFSTRANRLHRGWAEHDRRARYALEKFSMEVFNARVRDAALVDRPITWASSDEVSQIYKHLRLNSELIGHVDRARQASRSAGVLALSRADPVDVEQIAYGISMLHHSGDVKQLRSSLRTVRSQGPLSPLRAQAQQAVSRLLVQPVEVTLSRSDLALLEFGADLVEQSSIDTAVTAFIARRAARWSRDRAGTYRSDEQLWNAVRALAPFASDQDLLARAALAAADDNDPLVRNAIRRLIYVIDWERASTESREAWLSYAVADLGRDEQQVSAEVLIRLALSGVSQAFDALVEHWADDPALHIAAGLLHVVRATAFELQDQTISSIAAEAGRVIGMQRSEAASGSFSFGGTDPISVAVSLSLSCSQRKRSGILLSRRFETNVSHLRTRSTL